MFWFLQFKYKGGDCSCDAVAHSGQRETVQHKEVMAHPLPIDEALAEDEPTSSRPSP